jgi:pimeloyl-ACP methyl ester carboxylesterase
LTGTGPGSEVLGQGRTTVQTAAGPVRLRETGSGRPVLFLHGLLTDGHFWDRVTPLVTGSRLILPDLPLGAHRLAMPATADLSPPGLARLVADLMTALDLRDVVLVSADTGGAVAQLVAARYPERLGGFVLCSCDAFEHFFPPSFVYLQALGHLPGALWVAGQFMRLPGTYKQPPAFGWVQKRPVPAELAKYWLSPMGSDAGARRDLGKVLRGIRRRYTLQAAEQLRGCKLPTRLVWADTSKVFPIADGRRLAAMLPDATLTTVPDSYAHVAIDQPRAVADAINGLLG